MEGYVLGKVLEPEEKEGQEWKRWNARFTSSHLVAEFFDTC
jgi:hypothetical protein